MGSEAIAPPTEPSRPKWEWQDYVKFALGATGFLVELWRPGPADVGIVVASVGLMAVPRARVADAARAIRRAVDDATGSGMG